MFRISLVNMPFSNLALPSIALTQIKSVVESRFEDQVSVEVLYLSHDIAKYLGTDFYGFLATSMDSLNTGLGDWLFRQSAFPELPDNTEKYLQRYFPAQTPEMELLKKLIRQKPTWIAFDYDEWFKRRPRWSADTGTDVARVIRHTFGATELLTVLPARKYALQDRLPEMSAAELVAIARSDYTAVAMFDTLLAKGTLWTPRVYRVLDTIEDLDPDGVQALTVDYETGGERIPSLRAFLPLPANDAEAKGQNKRQQTIARYLLAPIYNSVVLPLPDGPRIIMTSPRWTASETPSSASTPATPAPYWTLTSSAMTMGSLTETPSSGRLS